MSLPKVIRSVGSRIIGRRAVVDTSRRTKQVVNADPVGPASPGLLAADVETCRNARIEVLTAATANAAVAAAAATRQANDQERARKQGSWLDYGSRS